MEDLIKQKETPSMYVDPPTTPTLEQIKHYRTYIKPRLYQLAIMIRDGRTEDEILSFLCLGSSEMAVYKRFFPDLKNAVAGGKLELVEACETALEKVATGFTYTEREVTEVSVPDDHGGFKVVSRKVRTNDRVKPPDVRALEFVLSNKTDDWNKNPSATQLTQNNNVVNLEVSQKDVQNVLDKIGGVLIDSASLDLPKKEDIVDADLME